MKKQRVVEQLNLGDPLDMIKLEQRVRDCNRASGEAKRVANSTKDERVKREMLSLADKLDKLSADISFEIDELADLDVDEIIKRLKPQTGEAKRGIIDGLNDLLNSNFGEVSESLLKEDYSLMSMTDDEYGDFINSAWDKIKKYSNEVVEKGNDEERQRNNSNMLTDHTALDIEDASNADVDRKGMIGKSGDEMQKKYGCGTLSDLEFDLWDTINEQIEEYKNSVLKYREDDDEDDVIIKSPESFIDTGKTKPRIEFYIDRSASWGKETDKKAAERAINSIIDFADDGLIDLEIFYFDDIITTDDSDYRLGNGCTYAWLSILQNIINNQTTNVVIMTDTDMEHRGAFGGPAHVVDGKVWWIWRAGTKSDLLPKKLKGRLGTGHYMFM